MKARQKKMNRSVQKFAFRAIGALESGDAVSGNSSSVYGF